MRNLCVFWRGSPPSSEEERPTVAGAGTPSGARCAVLPALGAVSATALWLAAAPAFAKPTGGTVREGTVVIIGEGTPAVTVTQDTPRAILEWEGFGNADGERIVFDHRAGPDSVTLNRVTGPDPSQIDGAIQANGHVWIVNRNGVAFGPTAQVDVGGLLATTADILDADFMAGDDRFSIPSPNLAAGVVNQGDITVADTGLVALAAPHVRNSGIIAGETAEIVLAGASTFTIDFNGDGLIAFEITGPSEAPVTEAVRNDGTVRVPGGTVLLTAEAMDGVVDAAITMDGVIEAQTVAMDGGRIVLSGGDHGPVRVAGTLDASGDDPGELGGTIEVRGETLDLASSAGLNASGDSGSGLVRLDSARDIAAAAPPGAIDAANVELTAGGSAGSFAAPLSLGATVLTVEFAVAQHAFLEAGSAAAGLDMFGSVGGDLTATVQRPAGIGSGGSGLTVGGGFDLLSTGSVIQAGPLVGAVLTGSVGGEVVLDDASNAIGMVDGFVTGTGGGEPGGFTLADAANGLVIAGQISTDGGAVDILTEDALTLAAPIVTSGGTVALESRNAGIGLGASIEAGTGAIALTAGGDILRTSGTLAAAGLSLNSGGDAGAVGAPLRFAPTGSTVALSTGGSVFLDILGPQTTTLLGSAGGSVTIGAGGPLQIGVGATGLAVEAALDLRSGPIGQASGTALVVGGQAALDPGGSSLLLANALNDFGGAVRITNAATASLSDAGDLTLGPVTVSGTFAAFAGGSIGQTGILETGPMALQAGGNILLASFANRTPVLAATAGSTLAFDHAGSLLVGEVSPAGGLATLSGLDADLVSLQAAGTLTQTRVVTAGQLAFRTGAAATLALSANSFGTLAAATGGPLELAGTGGFAVGTVPAAGSLAGLSGARSDGAMTLTAFGFGAAVATESGSGLVPAGALGIRADDMSLAGSIAAAGRTVTLEPLTPARTIGIGGAGAAGDFHIDGGELGGIAAASLQIGNAEAGQITLGRIDAGDVEEVGTLQLVTFEGIDFRGPLNGNLNVTLAPSPGSVGDIAFQSSVGDQVPLGSIVFAGGNDVSIADIFRVRDIVVGAIGGTLQNRNLTPGSDQPTGIAVDSLSIVGGSPLAARLFGTVGGIGGEQAALIATADPRNTEYQINGCVIGDLTSCIDFGVDVPAQALNLDLSNRRLFLPGGRDRHGDENILFSNTGNEELW